MPKLPISTQSGLTDAIELSYEQLQEISLLPNSRKIIATIEFGSALELAGVFIPNAFGNVSTAAVSVGVTGTAGYFVNSRSLSTASASYNSGSAYSTSNSKAIAPSGALAVHLYVTGDIANATSGRLIVGLRQIDINSLLNH